LPIVAIFLENKFRSSFNSSGGLWTHVSPRNMIEVREADEVMTHA